MTLRFLSIEHVPREGIGTISTYIRDLGASLTRHRQYRRQPLATPRDDYGVLVAMGGPMGAGDGDRHAWLDPELHFVREAIRRGKHVLGICLDAQMIARASNTSFFICFIFPARLIPMMAVLEVAGNRKSMRKSPERMVSDRN